MPVQHNACHHHRNKSNGKEQTLHTHPHTQRQTPPTKHHLKTATHHNPTRIHIGEGTTAASTQQPTTNNNSSSSISSSGSRTGTKRKPPCGSRVANKSVMCKLHTHARAGLHHTSLACFLHRSSCQLLLLKLLSRMS